MGLGECFSTIDFETYLRVGKLVVAFFFIVLIGWETFSRVRLLFLRVSHDYMASRVVRLRKFSRVRLLFSRARLLFLTLKSTFDTIRGSKMAKIDF